MSKRHVKRKQRQAKLLLILRYGYVEKDFFRVDEEDYMDGQRIEKGTWIIGYMSGYYEPEWTEYLPVDRLNWERVIERTDWDAEAKKDFAALAPPPEKHPGGAR